MTAREFRRIALGMTDAIESAHMGHPDFRVKGRIFATLHAGRPSGMVKLTPEQQAEVVREDPDAFEPESGAWGRQGCTRVWLARVDEDSLGRALTMAWQNVVRSTAARAAPRPSPTERPRRPGHRASGTEVLLTKTRGTRSRAQVRGATWKRPTTIDAGKYASVSKAILESLTAEPVTFTQLAQRVRAKLAGFEGSIPWYTVVVARELEVQGKLTRDPRPVRYSRPRRRHAAR